jgi:hypothetical protein
MVRRIRLEDHVEEIFGVKGGYLRRHEAVSPEGKRLCEAWVNHYVSEYVEELRRSGRDIRETDLVVEVWTDGTIEGTTIEIYTPEEYKEMMKKVSEIIKRYMLPPGYKNKIY